MEQVGTPNNRSEAFVHAGEIAIDIETKDPDLVELGPSIWRGGGYIVGVSLALENGLNTYLELNHFDTKPEVKERNERFLLDVLHKPSVKIGANILYDLMWLDHTYGTVYGTFRDVQYAEPLIDEYRPSFSLGSLCRYYDEQDKGTQELVDYCAQAGLQWTGSPLSVLWKMPAAAVYGYASWDAQATMNVYKKQIKVMEEQGLMDVYNMECGLIPLLLRMRKTGVRVDRALLRKNSLYLADKTFELEQELKKTLGNIDINSGAQLAKSLASMGVPIPRKPLTDRMIERGVTVGNPNLDQDSLGALGKVYPVCAKILEYRHYNTLISMFFVPYQKFLVGDRIRCQFHPLRSDKYGTVSGRFSSSGPNLQQVSGTSEEDEDTGQKGKLVRDLFIPEEGHLWAKLDYSQIEYRLQAHYATGEGADELRAEYNADPFTDFHQRVMDRTGLDRRKAKTLNFGASYGMGKETCAKKYGWTMEEANLFIDTYHAQHPFVRATRKAVISTASRRGYILTLLGRRARVHPSRKMHSMYNRLIQGSAADLMKKAMVDAWDKGIFDTLPVHLTVHDEIDVSFRPDNNAHLEALAELKDTMEKAIPCRIPIICDAEIGESWGSVREL